MRIEHEEGAERDPLPHVSSVTLGRGPRVPEHADLVTEMKSVRHYYDAGVTARDGIER
jgi:cob(I)alamin adenosyltransferase